MQPEYLASAYLACPSTSRLIRNQKNRISLNYVAMVLSRE